MTHISVQERVSFFKGEIFKFNHWPNLCCNWR